MLVDRRNYAGSRSSVRYTRGARFALSFVMPDRPGRNLWQWVRCLLVGHDDMMVRAPGRLWLRCTDCGRDTPGWRMGRAAPEPAQAQRGEILRREHRSRSRAQLTCPTSRTVRCLMRLRWLEHLARATSLHVFNAPQPR